MPQNLRQAASRTAQQSLINQLDGLGSSKSDFIQEDSLSAVEVAIGDFIKRVQNNLQQQDMIVSGRIADIQMQKTETGVNVIANNWLVYQDKGVNGSINRLYDTPFAYKTKRPPVQVFREWIERKNIQLRDNSSYDNYQGSDFEEADIDSAAYAMRENTFRNGIAPSNVYTNEIPQLIDDLGEGVINVLINSI